MISKVVWSVGCMMLAWGLACCHRAAPPRAKPVQIHIDGNPPRLCVGSPCAPLYVIDGQPLDPSRVPVNDTTSDPAKRFTPLEPDEIDSLKVIKGPEAVGLYGDAARDGAILIWTKRQKKPAADSARPQPAAPPTAKP